MSKTETDTEKKVKNRYAGIFVTETIFGNPNGSFVGNEPRNVQGRVFVTDKCVKYAVRRYLKEEYEGKDENGEWEEFVFFYPRHQGEDESKSDYLTRDSVFKKYMDKDFDKVLELCPDVRMFGGTFSFKKNDKQIYGPIQIMDGLDIMGGEIQDIQIGCPFSTGDGKQKTLGGESMVDHAVVTHDVVINPNNFPGLLRSKDLQKFIKGLIFGTNRRKTTSKTTDARMLILVKFAEGSHIHVGSLSGLVDVVSPKMTEDDYDGILRLDMSKVMNKLAIYEKHIENVIVFCDPSTEIISEDTGIKMRKVSFEEI